MIRLRVLIGSMLFLILIGAFQSTSVAAQGNPCPPGQEKENGCKWVQHQITGKCMWLPAASVSYPWIEVQPDGYCPPLQPAPTATATEPVVIQPTATSTVVQTEPPSETEEPGTDPTQAVLPTAQPNPPRQQPGGPGNLGLVVGGILAASGVIGLSAFFFLRKRTL